MNDNQEMLLWQLLKDVTVKLTTRRRFQTWKQSLPVEMSPVVDMTALTRFEVMILK